MVGFSTVAAEECRQPVRKYITVAQFVIIMVAVLYALACGATVAHADEYTVTLYTDDWGRSHGTVGFDPDQEIVGTEYCAIQKFETGMVTVYAFPAEGYEFYGWATSIQPFVCVSEEASFTFSLEELYEKHGSGSRLQLSAIFKEAGSTPCVVMLHSEKRKYGEWIGPYLVEKGSEFVLPENPFAREYPEKSPYYTNTSFLGWDAGRPGEAITVTSDMTIEALWNDEHTANVFFQANGGIGEMFCTYVEPGTTFILPECGFVHTDKVFAGWNLGKPGDVITVERYTSIEAQWKDPEPGEAYRLEFSTRLYDERKTINGAEVSEQSFWAHEGQPITLTSIYGDGMEYERAVSSGIVVQSMVISDGWEWSFLMPANDISIQVRNKWYDVRITFDPNGGAGEMKMQRIEKRSTYVLPDCTFVPPQGKEFDHWTLKELTKEEIMGGAVQNDIGDGKPGTEVYLKSSMELIATWKDAPPHVHSVVKVDAVPATCGTPGQEAYWKCSSCGKLFADAEGSKEIAAPVAIPAGHDWGEWEVTKEPTATTEGEKARTCKRDPSHTETAAIPATGEKPDPYAVIDESGTAPTWNPESDEGITFTVKRTEGDDTTYAHFTGVAVDGTSVPPLGYTAREGSLILTLLPEYLKSLGAGGHDVAILFDDGTVTASFTIAESGGETPGPGPEPAKHSLPAWAWILIGVAGAGAIAFAVLAIRKKQLEASAQATRRRPSNVHRR